MVRRQWRKLQIGQLTKISGLVLGFSVLTVFTTQLASWLRPAEAATETTQLNVRLDWTLTLHLGAEYAAGNCDAKPNLGNVAIPAVGNGNMHMACLNVFVDTTGASGYTLSLGADTAGLVGAPGTIAPTNSNMTAPTVLANDSWGFCIPNDVMSNVTNGFAAGLTTACGGRDTTGGGVAPTYRYAAVPTTSTVVRNYTVRPTTEFQRNTPIRFAVRPTARIASGNYSTITTLTAAINDIPPIMMQDFPVESCTAMQVGQVVTLVDARDGKKYRARRMPDGKCWMIDNLAYGGGGNNTYRDAVPLHTGTGAMGYLNEHTSGDGSRIILNPPAWNVSNNYRWFTNTAVLTNVSLAGGTPCSATTPTTDGASTDMTSICGNQYLYNYCAANGLDGATTPTCMEASYLSDGAGYTSRGIVGKARAEGGAGGESLGSGGSSLCPANWRLPVGIIGPSGASSGANSDNQYNEWDRLARSLNAGTNTAPVPAGQAGLLRDGFKGYFQPSGSSIAAGDAANGIGANSFKTVTAGAFSPGDVNVNPADAGEIGLEWQSGSAMLWTSSLQTVDPNNSVLSFGISTAVTNNGVSPVSSNNGRRAV